MDTNVISELRKPQPNEGVVSFVSGQPESLLFLSEVTFAEIRFGIEQVTDVERRGSLDTWVKQKLRPLFSGRTLPITEDTIFRWRLKVEAGRRRGHSSGQLDLFIAAIAEENELVAVTRDVINFVAAGVPVFNPWTAQFVSADGSEHGVSDLASAELVNRLERLNRLPARS